jgi:hypothetical protein
MLSRLREQEPTQKQDYCLPTILKNILNTYARLATHLFEFYRNFKSALGKCDFLACWHLRKCQ